MGGNAHYEENSAASKLGGKREPSLPATGWRGHGAGAHIQRL